MPVIDFPTSPEGVRKQQPSSDVFPCAPIPIEIHSYDINEYPCSPFGGMSLLSDGETLAHKVHPDYARLFAASPTMREALLFIKDFLIKKENATGEGDFLHDIRRESHAPLHAKIDEALMAADEKRL